VLLGLNQGLSWSMTVNMKIDLVGPARRGLATGLNEAAGYTAVGVTALLTGYLATAYGLRPAPELLGVVFVVTGLALSLVVRDTAAHVALELAQHPKPLPDGERIGHLTDRIGRKPLIVYGMLVQAGGFVLALALLERPLLAGISSAVALGIGTAMVYPALIASVSDHAHPAWRANALGTYRFWRDIGYAAGALLAGLLADAFGLNATVIAAAVLTAASGLLAARWITEHRSH
jgi:MFS family permease